MFSSLWHEWVVPDRFMPHGHCYQWQPDLVALHAVSDLVTFVSYLTIPLMLAHLSRDRADLPFRGLLLAFVAFIGFCGLAHLCEVWTLWQPAYWVSGSLKGATAVASALTAVSLYRNLPDILDLPTAEQLGKVNTRLAASERRFRTAIAHLHEGFSILEPLREADGRIGGFAFGHVNLAMARSLGRSTEELLDRPLRLATPELGYLFDALLELLDSGASDAIVTSPGLPRLEHQLVDIGPEGVLVVTRDITEQLEAAITRERLARIVDSSPDAIISVRRDGTVASWNGAARTLVGRAADEAMGKPISSLLELEGPGADAVQAVLDGDTGRTGEDRLSPTGVPVSMRVSPLLTDDGVDGAVVVLRDLTDSRQAAELRRSLERQDLLLREIHHRVKNNLQVVSSLLNLSLHDIESGRVSPRAALTDSRDRVTAIALLHEQLQTEDDLGATDMDVYLRRLTRRLFSSHALPDQRIDVQRGGVCLELPIAMPLCLVVNELVSNALAHGLGTGSGRVSIALTRDGDDYQLIVTDSGAPFPPDLEVPGPRLGLRLVDRLVGQLGGTLSLQSHPDKRVVIRWPRSPGRAS